MIILRSLCLMHQASSPDNITHVGMVDDDLVADFGLLYQRMSYTQY